MYLVNLAPTKSTQNSKEIVYKRKKILVYKTALLFHNINFKMIYMKKIQASPCEKDLEIKQKRVMKIECLDKLHMK